MLVDRRRSREYNTLYRQKEYATNILSFPLDKETGELLLTVAVAHEEARALHVDHAEYLLYLLVHGMLHLRGAEHGKKMEHQEYLYLAPLTSSTFISWLRQK